MVDEFKVEVKAIKRSPWFVDQCDEVLTDVFNGMTNLRLSGTQKSKEDREKFEKFLLIAAKEGKKKNKQGIHM